MNVPENVVSRPADAPDVSVIVVSYNVRPFLEQALTAIDRAGQRLRTEVFVVDNCSSDSSAQMVRSHFPHVHLIENAENVGFSHANNQAIRRARGRYLFLLNPDTVIGEDTLEALVSFMDRHPGAGAVGCTIITAEGTFAPESRRAFPTPAVAFYRLSGLSRLFPHSPRFGRYNLTYLPVEQVCEVDALSGSCMMVRARALTASADGAGAGAGLLDESFFMYGEDLDWCYQIQQAGWKIYYTPETRILHYKGESTRRSDLQYVRRFYGAMWQFAEKHFRHRYPRVVSRAIRASVLAAALVNATFGWLRQHTKPSGSDSTESLLLVGGDPYAFGSQLETGLPFTLAGYVDALSVRSGGTQVLLDALKSHHATTVVLSAEAFEYGTILCLLQELGTYAVACRILSPDGKWLLGKRRAWPMPEVSVHSTSM